MLLRKDHSMHHDFAETQLTYLTDLVLKCHERLKRGSWDSEQCRDDYDRYDCAVLVSSSLAYAVRELNKMIVAYEKSHPERFGLA
jgi:hypothetical protein